MTGQLCGVDTSAAVLVGCHSYEDLEPLPAVRNNLTDLAGLLTDPSCWGIRQERVTVLSQPCGESAVLRAVRAAADAATDALVVYYAGHGLLDPVDEELYLSLPGSRLGDFHVESALRFEILRRVFLSSAAEKKVLLLDCCYSGRAMVGEMGGGTLGGILPTLDVAGTCLITACAENARALAPPGEPNTAFTASLLRALREGVPGAGDVLDMTTLYEYVRGELRARSLPLPQQRSRNTAAHICLARNRAATPGRADGDEYLLPAERHRATHTHVTVLGRPLTVGAVKAVKNKVTELGGWIDSERHLGRYPVSAVLLEISGVARHDLQRRLAPEAAAHQLDLAVEEPGLRRHARRLVLLNPDFVLLQKPTLDLIASHASDDRAAAIAELTAAGARGERDPDSALHDSVALLKGLPTEVLDRARADLRLTGGSRTFIRTLKRLGHQVGIISDGFHQLTDYLVEHLDLDFSGANTLEIYDGKLTGRLVGMVVKPAVKADLLRRFTAEAGVPLPHTIAVGATPSDVPMLRAAGMAIGFNPHPAVRDIADTTITTPFLDSILFLLGITRAEIEQADEA